MAAAEHKTKTPKLWDPWVARASQWQSRAEETHVWRMNAHYGDNNGNVLAGGIAYFSLTSIASGVLIAVTISSMVIGRNPEARATALDFLENVIPGIVGEGDDVLLEEGNLPQQSISGIIGIGAFLVLFFTATRYIGGLRQAVQTMLGRDTGSLVTGKLRDLSALLVIALLVILGMALQVMASQASSFFADLLSDDPLSEWVLRGPALAVGLVVDMAFAWIAIKYLGRSARSLRELVWVLLAAAIGVGLLRMGSSLIISSVAENPVLGSFAAVITLLIFADFVARILLYASAWLGTREDSLFNQPHPELIEGEVDEAGGPR